MKKIIFFICIAFWHTATIAQDEYEVKSSRERAAKDGLTEGRGFNPNKMFVGSSFNIGFGAGGNGVSAFNIGLNPEVGYSLTKWLDAGVIVNINYFTYRENYANGDRYKENNFTYGAGIFTRIYPIQEFFLTAVPEYNFINRRVQLDNSSPNFKVNQEAFSVLAGIGYGRRFIGQSGFYSAILFDLADNEGSPYITADLFGRRVKNPIFRFGFTTYLGKKPRR